MLMYQTTCQSEAAKQMGISQGKVRHRFIRTIEKMETLQTEAERLDMLLEMEHEDRLDVWGSPRRVGGDGP